MKIRLPIGRLPALVLALALALGLALAMTPAGTAIQNQASASYIDSAGQPRTTTSNMVVTVVQQVYSLSIDPNGSSSTPGQTRSGLPGAPVYFSYIVSNTGNGTDTINLSLNQATTDNFDLASPAFYLDANCNGLVDSTEPSISSLTLAANTSVCVVLKGTIPSGSSSGHTANFDLEGTSAGSPTVKDIDNWARATVSTVAILTATKAASPTGTVNPGSTITYTISGSNSGGSAASGVNVPGLGTGILVSDVIPTNLTVNTMPNGSAGAGTVQYVYTTDGTNWSILNSANLPLTGNGTIAIGMFIAGSTGFFPQTADYTFSFEATVPTTALPGTSYTNTATVRYNDGSSDQTVTTNSTPHTVAASYNVAVGPHNHPLGAASGSYIVGGYPVSQSGDEQTIASAKNGTQVIFRHTLRNTGNAPDAFNLSLSGAPSGWLCTFVADDLTTPISGPGLVGPVAPNTDYHFALSCTIPPPYASSSAVNLTVTATSQNDPTKSNTTTDTVSEVVDGFRFDLYGGVNGTSTLEQSRSNPSQPFHSDDSTSDPARNIFLNPTITFPSANPGGQVVYRLRIQNLNFNGQADSYNLLVNPQAGYAGRVASVVFYADTDDNGVPDGAPITSTPLIPYNNEFKYIAVVTLSPSAPPGPAGFNFEAQSGISGAEGVDYAYTQIEVNTVAQILLDPDRAGTVASPGTIEYSHTITNSSNETATGCTISGSGSYGWTYLYSDDGGATWYPSLGGFNLTPGSSRTIKVRVLVPSGQPIGRTDVNVVTLSCGLGAAGTVTATATEATTVVGGELSLTKEAISFKGAGPAVRNHSGAEALPGDQIQYTITAQNIGTGDLKKVIVADPIPAYTTFVSGSLSVSLSGFSGTPLYSTDGSTWSTTPPTSLSPGQSIYVALDTNGDSTITDADVMPPGASITVTFRVQVQ